MLDQSTTPPMTKQQELRMTIQRLRMKALAVASCAAVGGADDDNEEEQEQEESAPPASHPRLKRRLQCGDDMCDCESDVEPTIGGDDEDGEFTGPDGSFKLPRLMHPVLKRQHAVSSIKHGYETVERVSPRLMLLSKPSRVRPCFLSRAIDLRFVQ